MSKTLTKANNPSFWCQSVNNHRIGTGVAILQPVTLNSQFITQLCNRKKGPFQ
jgi:hypothetical protein